MNWAGIVSRKPKGKWGLGRRWRISVGRWPDGRAIGASWQYAGTAQRWQRCCDCQSRLVGSFHSLRHATGAAYSVEGTNPEEFQKKWQLSLDRLSVPILSIDSGDGVLVWFTQESGTLRDPADVLAGSSGKQTLAIL